MVAKSARSDKLRVVFGLLYRLSVQIPLEEDLSSFYHHTLYYVNDNHPHAYTTSR